MSEIGFIGLGIMGRPMALNLINGGHRHWRTAGAEYRRIWRRGGQCGSPSELAQQADVVIMMLPDTPDVEKVLFGDNGVAQGLTPGKIVVDMSSIAPIATKTLANRVRNCGCEYLDAPVSGGEIGARNASLAIMVGGARATFEESNRSSNS